MASYPGPKVHRNNRRKLGRGQFVGVPGVTVVVTDTGSVATLTFSRPVNVAGIIPVTVTGGPTFVSQAVVSSTVVTQTFSAALSTHPYSIPSGAANVSSYQGGQLIGTAGTFS
jgi:hypothetical protein